MQINTAKQYKLTLDADEFAALQQMMLILDSKWIDMTNITDHTKNKIIKDISLAYDVLDDIARGVQV